MEPDILAIIILISIPFFIAVALIGLFLVSKMGTKKKPFLKPDTPAPPQEPDQPAPTPTTLKCPYCGFVGSLEGGVFPASTKVTKNIHYPNPQKPKKCQACHRGIPTDSKFCEHCGVPIT